MTKIKILLHLRKIIAAALLIIAGLLIYHGYTLYESAGGTLERFGNKIGGGITIHEYYYWFGAGLIAALIALRLLLGKK